jgi:hypothetical protein
MPGRESLYRFASCLDREIKSDDIIPSRIWGFLSYHSPYVWFLGYNYRNHSLSRLLGDAKSVDNITFNIIDKMNIINLTEWGDVLYETNRHFWEDESG